MQLVKLLQTATDDILTTLAWQHQLDVQPAAGAIEPLVKLLEAATEGHPDPANTPFKAQVVQHLLTMQVNHPQLRAAIREVHTALGCLSELAWEPCLVTFCQWYITPHNHQNHVQLRANPSGVTVNAGLRSVTLMGVSALCMAVAGDGGALAPPQAVASAWWHPAALPQQGLPTGRQGALSCSTC